MKKTVISIIQLKSALLIAGLLALPTWLPAQPKFTGHYPAGAEGIKAGTLPPPGIYLRDYNIFYFADRFRDGPSDFDVFAYVNAPRLIWITDWQILGGNYGMDILVPFYYADVEVGSFTDDTFALGDIHVEPITLSWNPKQFNLAVGYAFWAPNGDHDRDGTRPSRLLSKGFWSHMFTAGATWYPDDEKTWAVSVLNRYEIHHEHRDFDITPGNTYTLEWGLSKSLKPTIDVGVVGYYQQQTTKDSGTGSSDIKDRVVGVGPEIAAVCPKLGLITSVRYLREFAAKDRPEGNTITVTFTKRW